MEVRTGKVRYRPFQPEDLGAVQDIIRQSFTEEVDSHPQVLSEYLSEAYYQPENLLVAELEDRVVSQMGLRDGDLWLWGCPFPAALVGTVCTLPDFRGQGIGGGLLRYSFGVLSRWAMALSYLHTIPERHNFYRRLGYTDTVHEQTVLTADLAELDAKLLEQQATLPQPVRRRRALPADVPILESLYRGTAGRGTGAWSRNSLFWRRRLLGRPKLWLAGCPDFELAVADRPLAYVATIREGSEWRILELAYRGGADTVARALVAGVLGAAQKVGAEGVRVTLPRWMASEELLSVLASQTALRQDRVFVRLHDVGRFLELATPVLAERADAADLTVGLSLSGTPSHHVHFGSGSRQLAVALGPSQLAALFYNGDALPDLLKANSVKARPESAHTMELLRGLFPPTRAARFPMDGY